MYAYETIDYWIMIDMIGFTAEWYWTQVENPLSGAKRLPLGVMPQSKGGLPPLWGKGRAMLLWRFAGSVSPTATVMHRWIPTVLPL